MTDIHADKMAEPRPSVSDETNVVTAGDLARQSSLEGKIAHPWSKDITDVRAEIDALKADIKALKGRTGMRAEGGNRG